MDTCVGKDHNHRGTKPYFKGVDGAVWVVHEQPAQIISGGIYILHQMSCRIVYSTHLQT